MALNFEIFDDDTLKEEFVNWLITSRWPENLAHFARLWDYYQNPSSPLTLSPASAHESSHAYMQAQEVGLPPRITGQAYAANGGLDSGKSVGDIRRKEIVIENDIAWRVNVMVDFLFGKGATFVSRAQDPQRRNEIEQILKAVLEANGGAGFFQDMAVLGSVYGFVDCLVRPGFELLSRLASTSPLTSQSFTSVLQQAQAFDLELIEAPRALPVLDEKDYRKIQAYVLHFHQPQNDVSKETNYLTRLVGGKEMGLRRKVSAMTEIIGPAAWQQYENEELVRQSINPLGFVPVVHIQNMAQPLFYEGISDVEQLLGLQDELNTRLSDRANRITFQAFKMYLLKCMGKNAGDSPVSPGFMWYSNNPEAKIEEIGGDNECPGENQHIAEIREAMDKISGVTPVVAGVLKNKLGNLTSGMALKMTFMGMLTKNARKQFTYGRGLVRIGQMILEILDKAGIYKTTLDERRLEAVFPNPLPEDESEKLAIAKLKTDLGIPTNDVLKELGYEIKSKPEA